MSATHRLRNLLLVALLFGLIAPDAHSRAGDSGQLAPAQRWVLHIPGMGGTLTPDRMLVQGLAAGGVNGPIEIYDWTGEDRGMIALAQPKRHAAQSSIVAEMIRRRAAENPGEPITVVAHSAGAGIAVWALEKLPDDVLIDDLVLIASALSPDYDLSKALRHVRGSAYAFNSELDIVLMATRFTGTVDRVIGESGGRIGFSLPDSADERQYRKLVQIPYDKAWMRLNHNGEHIGPMMRPFARNVIAKVILGQGLPPNTITLPATRPSTQPSTQPTTSPSS